jgi:hypothetical protein
MNNPLFVRFAFNFSFGATLGFLLTKFFPEGVNDIDWWIGLIILNSLVILYRRVNNTLDEAINNKKNT